MHVTSTRTRRGGGGVEYWKGLFLVWKLDVHKGGESLYGCGVLCMIKKIPMTGLKLRVPVDDIEWRACWRTLLLSLWILAIASK